MRNFVLSQQTLAGVRVRVGIPNQYPVFDYLRQHENFGSYCRMCAMECTAGCDRKGDTGFRKF